MISVWHFYVNYNILKGLTNRENDFGSVLLHIHFIINSGGTLFGNINLIVFSSNVLCFVVLFD